MTDSASSLIPINFNSSTLQEIRRRGLKVVVAGIPKTIDNDIPVPFLVIVSYTMYHLPQSCNASAIILKNKTL